MSPRLAYLNCLRAASSLFRQDRFALRSAFTQLRLAFDQHRLETDPARIATCLAEAKEARDFMRHNLVQAKRTARGTYAVELKPDPVTREFAPRHPNEVVQNDDPVCEIKKC